MFENDKLKNRLLDAGRGKVTYALYKKDGNVYEVPKQVAFEMLTNDWYTNFSVDDIDESSAWIVLHDNFVSSLVVDKV